MQRLNLRCSCGTFSHQIEFVKHFDEEFISVTMLRTPTGFWGRFVEAYRSLCGRPNVEAEVVLAQPQIQELQKWLQGETNVAGI